MHISKECAVALRVQLFFIAVFTAFIFGLYLLCKGGTSVTIYWVVFPVCLFFTPRAWLRDIKAVWLRWWDMDRDNTHRLLLTVLAATVVFSLAANLYAFTNEFFNHDSLGHIAYFKGLGGLSNGRPLLTLFDSLAGTVAQPWLLGMLFMLWMFPASVLAVRILRIQSTAGRVLLCGLLCTNTCLSDLFAHYTYCASDYALALLAIIAAAWFFTQCRHGEILGVYCIVFSLSLYQAYFTAGVAFCFFAVILMLARNENARLAVLKGIRYVALLVAGFLMYYLIWSMLCSVYGVERIRGGDLTLSHGIKYFLIKLIASVPHFFGSQLSSGDFIDRIAQTLNLTSGESSNPIIQALQKSGDFFSGGAAQALHITSGDFLGSMATAVKLLVMAMIVFWLVCWLMDKQLAKSNKVLLTLSVCALPVVLDLSYALFSVGTMSLVSVNMGFLGVFLLLCQSCPAPAAPVPRRCRVAVFLLTAALLWQNIVYSNSIYIKMDLNKSATISLFTRVIERVELTEGYMPGETPVAFSGTPNNNQFLSRGRAGFEWFTDDTGAAVYDYSATYSAKRYIQNYLNYPMNIVDSLDPEEITDMPVFPLDGSVAWVDGIIVVKLS